MIPRISVTNRSATLTNCGFFILRNGIRETFQDTKAHYKYKETIASPARDLNRQVRNRALYETDVIALRWVSAPQKEFPLVSGRLRPAPSRSTPRGPTSPPQPVRRLVPARISERSGWRSCAAAPTSAR